jgi:hypothetical protein
MHALIDQIGVAMAATDALEASIARYRRAFSRGIGFNPNSYQRALMSRAAALAALADQALHDPLRSDNDRVRLCGAADRAHTAMMKALQGSRHVKAVNPFDAYAAQKASA